METHFSILPECYADTVLIEIAGFKHPNHQPSIGQVANSMKKRPKTKLIGVVDDDKNKPAYFSQFVLLEEKDRLSKYKHPDREHYLIILSPAFEKWIYDAATDVNVDPEKYGFKSMKRFKNATKNQFVSNNQEVKRFLNDIKQRKNSPMQTLIRWIREIL